MKSTKGKISKVLFTSIVLFSFVFSISFLSFKQVKSLPFVKASKALNDFHKIKDHLYSTEYNLSSFLCNTDEFRISSLEEERDYLHFHTYLIPYLTDFHHYYKNKNFSLHFRSDFNYKLYSIPPPTSLS
ncbi:MAG TPA: hypothetical protein PKL30_23145 [Leptospiraceae bacterium]|nr:hypothetical protein [Leptospiraceae bacterium]HMW08491.1 hypothetical protein [Leptospiraceae bacterium]HMX33331.1 hypothetical protein [Leptospiraceae bacterium]HMY34076.1 hypothetical protein [Leptospiraceae bacterium]HMZ64593.1 hypothetical protein [Leptospiraceae bacterium]